MVSHFHLLKVQTSSLPTHLNWSVMEQLPRCGNITHNSYTTTQMHFYWLQCGADSLNIYIFWEDQQSGPHIENLNDYGFYACVFKHKPHNNVQICECLGQCLSIFQLYIKTSEPFGILFPTGNQWYTFHWRDRYVIIIVIYKTDLLAIRDRYYSHINLWCTLCNNTGELCK